MTGREGIPPEAVINIVLFALIFNVLVMALGFVIVAGIAFFRASTLAGLFAPAAGLLTLIATVLGALRNALVRLLEDFAV